MGIGGELLLTMVRMFSDLSLMISGDGWGIINFNRIYAVTFPEAKREILSLIFAAIFGLNPASGKVLSPNCVTHI